MSEITYDDKVDLQVATNIANINKVTASDMNEIKNVVNGNAEEVGDITSLTTTDKTNVVNAVNELNAPGKWVSVGATAPTDGRRVWFEKGKNLFDIDSAYHGTISGTGGEGSNENYRTSYYIPTTPNTTYYFSTTQISGQTNKQIYIAYYNSSTTFVSRTSYNLLESAFTTPANCYYMRAGVGSAWQENIMLELGSQKTSYEPYVEPSINVDNEQWYSKPKVLWENANTTQDFGPSSITLNDSLENYRYYEVIVKQHKSLGRYYSTGKIPADKYAVLFSAIHINSIRPVTAINNTNKTISFDNSVEFTTYNNANSTTNNARNIPFQIIGYK